mmetsp:Transcript_104174/g.181020  ORF Transcript_104174/g.181020 Transcript_104174/m.181020 type:complete len:94 (-) Transcript_104174:768-1049(-)
MVTPIEKASDETGISTVEKPLLAFCWVLTGFGRTSGAEYPWVPLAVAEKCVFEGVLHGETWYDFIGEKSFSISTSFCFHVLGAVSGCWSAPGH